MDDLWGRISFYAAALLSGRLPGCCVVMEQVNTLRRFGLGTELNWAFGPNRALTSWNGALELLLCWFKSTALPLEQTFSLKNNL